MLFNSEECPSCLIACFYGLETCGLDRITTHRMHPFDGLLGGWKIVHVFGLPQRLSSLLGWVVGLPLALPLLEQDAIAPAAVADPN